MSDDTHAMPVPTASVDAAVAPAERRLGLGLLSVGVLSSLLASTCCVLPLVLVLLGISGAWIGQLAVLRPWTPLFTFIALAALAGAGYLVFRPAGQCTPVMAACDVGARSLSRRLYLVGALFASSLLLFPLLAPVFY